jgi:hypothetical protein
LRLLGVFFPAFSSGVSQGRSCLSFNAPENSNRFSSTASLSNESDSGLTFCGFFPRALITKSFRTHVVGVSQAEFHLIHQQISLSSLPFPRIDLILFASEKDFISTLHAYENLINWNHFISAILLVEVTLDKQR